jgi:hypothetical protein
MNDPHPHRYIQVHNACIQASRLSRFSLSKFDRMRRVMPLIGPREGDGACQLLSDKSATKGCIFTALIIQIGAYDSAMATTRQLMLNLKASSMCWRWTSAAACAFFT